MKQKKSQKLHQEINYRNRRRFGLFFLLIVISVFIIFSYRFIWIVSTHQASGVNLNQKQEQIHQSKTILPANRGHIFDQNGNIIAQNDSKFTITATTDKRAGMEIDGNKSIPLYVTNKETVAKLISDNLPISKDLVFKQLKLNGYQIRFGAGGDNIPVAVKDKIEKQIKKEKITGIEFLRRPARLYNGGVFASQIVGIADLMIDDQEKSNAQLVGKLGIEREFDAQLSGKNGYIERKVNLRAGFGDRIVENRVNSSDGKDIYLTLNSDFQKHLEALVTQVNENYHPLELNSVMMEAKTGRIIAATQRPSFDTNTLKGLSDMWRDHLVEDTFEPGSVFKAVTLSTAIDLGVYNPNEYYDSGSIKIGPNIIYDWQKNGWGLIPMSQAFPRSSNVGFVHLEQKIGKDRWQKAIKNFGFCQKTGITLPNEQAGFLSFKEPIDQATTAFGQGISVNVIQLLQAYTAIANQGQIIKPQIVKKIVNPANKNIKLFKIVKKGRPISVNAANETLNEMRRVVNEKYGTGVVYAVPNLDLAVKTGTAEISTSNGSGYLGGSYDYLYSVMGIYPANNPRYIFYASMKKPQIISKQPEQILSEIFKPMVTYSMSYSKNYQSLKNYDVTVPNLANFSRNEAQDKLLKKGLKPIIIGSGTNIVQQLPYPHTKVLNGDKIILLTNGAMVLPDLTGWSKSDVIKLGQITGKNISINGNGYVSKQSLPPGSSIDFTKKISVDLKENTNEN